MNDLTNLSNCVNTHYDKIIKQLESLKSETIKTLTNFSNELEVFGLSINVSGNWYFISGNFNSLENTKVVATLLKKYEKLLYSHFYICYTDTSVRTFRRHTDLSDKSIDKIKMGSILKHYCI